ncbi:acetyl-CoA carboxylase biotin carboxyl carrier protein [Candidatus Margulisiibacteriota bacterium]
MDLKEVKRLINMVEEAKITHFSIETDGTKIEIKKDFNHSNPQAQTVILPSSGIQQAMQPTAMTQSAEVQIQEPKEEQRDENLVAITAVMIGTFYLTPNPDAAPYVKIGSKINKGDTVCLIEAMKLFNEIKSDFSGTIEKIYVETGSPVEYGQELFLVRKE